MKKILGQSETAKEMRKLLRGAEPGGTYLIGGEPVQIQHFLSVVGDAAEVWCGNRHQVIRSNVSFETGTGLFVAGAHGGCSENDE